MKQSFAGTLSGTIVQPLHRRRRYKHVEFRSDGNDGTENAPNFIDRPKTPARSRT